MGFFFYVDSWKWVISRAEIEPVLIHIPIREAAVKQHVFGYCSAGELRTILASRVLPHWRRSGHAFLLHTCNYSAGQVHE